MTVPPSWHLPKQSVDSDSDSCQSSQRQPDGQGYGDTAHLWLLVPHRTNMATSLAAYAPLLSLQILM